MAFEINAKGLEVQKAILIVMDSTGRPVFYKFLTAHMRSCGIRADSGQVYIFTGLQTVISLLVQVKYL